MTDPQDHFAALFDHTYMRWFDLQGQPALMRIIQADRKVEMTLPGGATSRKPVLTMEQVQGQILDVKPMVLNATNATAIAAIHGNSVSGWIGKEIVLFQTERMLRGKPVEAIGVRAKKEQAK